MFCSWHYEFTPLPMRHIIQSTIQMTILKTTYWIRITATMDIYRFIIQLSTLMTMKKSSEAIWGMRCVTEDDNNYHDYRPSLCNPANGRNIIRSRYSVEHYSYQSAECDHQPEYLQWTRWVASNNYYHDDIIRAYPREGLNTIPTSQFMAIISLRTYNQWRDLTRESAKLITDGEVHQVSASCITTTLATSKTPGGQQK